MAVKKLKLCLEMKFLTTFESDQLHFLSHTVQLSIK